MIFFKNGCKSTTLKRFGKAIFKVFAHFFYQFDLKFKLSFYLCPPKRKALMNSQS